MVKLLAGKLQQGAAWACASVRTAGEGEALVLLFCLCTHETRQMKRAVRTEPLVVASLLAPVRAECSRGGPRVFSTGYPGVRVYKSQRLSSTLYPCHISKCAIIGKVISQGVLPCYRDNHGGIATCVARSLAYANLRHCQFG